MKKIIKSSRIVTPDEVITIADAHLPKASQKIEIVRAAENSTESASVFKARSEKRMKVSKPIFNIGVKDIDIPRSPIERLKKDAAMSILNEILFSRAGKLYSELFESAMISPEMSYCYTINESFAFNSIAGEADDPDAVLEKIRDHIQKTSEQGLAKSDFERGKRVMYAEFVKEFDSTEGIANSLFSFVFEGAEILTYAEIINSVSFDDVSSLFEKVFKDEFFTISVVYPLDRQ